MAAIMGDIEFIREKRWRSRYVLTVRRGDAGDDWRVVARIPDHWGQEQIDRMLFKHRRWLQKRAAERMAKVARRAEQDALQVVWCELPESWYRKSARIVLKRRCDVWARAMGIGYGSLRITGARSRWGSCSSLGNLSFSWRLLATRWDLIEYVIVHELAHRVHFNHGTKFWRLVERYVPDYAQKRDDLRRLGGELG